MTAEDVQQWQHYPDWRKYVDQQAQRVEDASSGEEASPSSPPHEAARKRSARSARRQGKQRKPLPSREELLQRLINPLVTLQEAAIILEVCPATVRRYADSGLLKCFRTNGNQRRFRFLDVMAFEQELRRDPRRGPRNGKASPSARARR